MMIVTFILLSALIFVLLFVSDFSWSDVLNTQRNTLVFEGRNQEYGAFAQRKEYHRNVMWALLFSVGVVGGGLSALQQATKHQSFLPFDNPGPVILTTLTALPKEEKQVEKLPEEKQNKPVKKGSPESGQVQNTTPEIVDSGPVDAPKAQDDFADKSLGGTGDPAATVFNVGPREVGGGGDDDKGEKKRVAEDFVEIMPEFPGGIDAMRRFFIKNVYYSEEARSLGKEGTVWITFIVSESGEVQSVQVKRGIDGAESLNKSAMAAVKKMPRWIPGSNGKEPKAVWMTIPVKFVLQK